MIRYTVLGGYLGAGKTTLLNHILKHNDGTRIALLINDFGAINIDAALIESQTDQQINLANGCICCSLSDGFFEAVDTLREMQPAPDQIIVEASGVADVHKLSQYGHGQGLTLGGVVMVADAETIRSKSTDKYVGTTIQRQLQAADLVVLNKCDLVSPAKAQELSDWLRSATGGAPVVRAERCAIPLSLLLDVQPREHAPLGAATHAHYASWQFTTQNAPTRQQTELFLAGLPDSVLRAKGFVLCNDGTCLELQVVGRRRSVEPSRQSHATQLVAIGLAEHFSARDLDVLAAKHLATS